MSQRKRCQPHVKRANTRGEKPLKRIKIQSMNCSDNLIIELFAHLPKLFDQFTSKCTNSHANWEGC